MPYAGAVLPVLKQLYSVAHSTDYGRRQGKKQQPKVSRAKLDNGDVIVGEAPVGQQLGCMCIEKEFWHSWKEALAQTPSANRVLCLYCVLTFPCLSALSVQCSNLPVEFGSLDVRQRRLDVGASAVLGSLCY